MRLAVVCVGKAQGAFADLSAEYERRIARYAPFEVIEVAEEKYRGTPSPGDARIVLSKEADRIRAALRGRRYVVLDPGGVLITSEELARSIERDALASRGDLAFVIGGSLGLDASLKEAAESALALSRMTFPHQIARVVLLEQLYRAHTILRGEPYHK